VQCCALARWAEAVRPRQTRTITKLAQGYGGSPRVVDAPSLGYHQEAVAPQSAVRQPSALNPPLASASLCSALLFSSRRLSLRLPLPHTATCYCRSLQHPDCDTHAATPAATHWPKCPSPDRARLWSQRSSPRLRSNAPLCLLSLVSTPAFWPDFTNHRCSLSCMLTPSPSDTTDCTCRLCLRVPSQARPRTPRRKHLGRASLFAPPTLVSPRTAASPHRLLQRERAGLPHCPRPPATLVSAWLCIAPGARLFAFAGNLRAHPRSTSISRRFAAVLPPGSIRRQRPTRTLTAVGAGPDAFGSIPPSARLVDRDPPHFFVPTTADATP
jgi:hypothetical protein